MVTSVVLAALLAAHSVRADVSVASDVRTEYDACISKLRAAGFGGVLDRIAPGHTVEVERSDKPAGPSQTAPSSLTDDRNGSGADATISWNPTDISPLKCDGVALDPCATLLHELHHAADITHGANYNRVATDTCHIEAPSGIDIDTGISIAELEATREENSYRAKAGLPQRKQYGLFGGSCADVTVLGTCRDPPPYASGCGGCAKCCPIGAPGAVGADVSGDPHLRSFDQFRYDFQAVGEFVFARSTAGDLEVQGRQVPAMGSTDASLLAAVTANVARDHFGLYLVDGAMKLHVNGVVTALEGGFVTLPRGGSVEATAEGALVVRWTDGSVLSVRRVGTWGLRASMTLAKTRKGSIEGLFGNFDGDDGNDLVAHGGARLPSSPAFTDLYPVFADSWRVEASASLFDYAPGETTATFTNRAFPAAPTKLGELPGYAAASAICKDAGIVDAVALDNCTLDVLLTGQVVFATDGAATEAASGVLLSIDKAGGSASFSFTANAGERLFIEVPVTSLPDDCDPLQLFAPASTKLAQGCIVSNEGFIDTLTAPTTGAYSLSVVPTTATTGKARVLVHRPRDVVGTIVPNGPEATASIDQPGAMARFTFDAAAGDKVSAVVSASTLADDCSPLRIVAPDGTKVADGCIVNGKGSVDSVTLGVSGTYSLLFDPTGAKTGKARLRVVK